MKKNDIVLVLAILVIAGVIFTAYRCSYKEEGVFVIITVDGAEYERASLKKNMIIDVEGQRGINSVEIKDGSVSMIAAECPDQICVKHKKIQSNQEKIVCLPNKVIVEISGGQADDMDAVVY